MHPITRTLCAVVVLSLAALAPAHAQRERRDVAVAGKYEATFAKVSDNCGADGPGMNLTKVAVTLEEPRKGRIAVTVPMVPFLNGIVSRGGKFKAEAKRGKTAIEGVEGRFTTAGRVEGDAVQLLFIAEYFKAGKPLCTQSWNATGPRG